MVKHLSDWSDKRLSVQGKHSNNLESLSVQGDLLQVVYYIYLSYVCLMLKVSTQYWPVRLLCYFSDMNFKVYYWLSLLMGF